MGLPKIHQRNLEDPTRVSSLFHWRTLQRLLSWTPPHISSPLSYSSEFVDSHCHLDRLFRVSGYTGSLDGFLEQRRFVEPGFKGCITVFCDEASLSKWESQKALIESTGVHAAVGYHPKNAHNFTKDAELLIRHVLDTSNVCALGEIGLDYSGSYYRYKEKQQAVFKKLLVLAVNSNLPVVLHCRDAEPDCFKIVRQTLPRMWRIHLHCYMNDWEGAKVWFDSFPNLCVGLTNAVGLGSPGPRDVALNIPLDRLLLETDAPYFPPTPARFSIPTMAKHVAEEVAKIRGITVAEVLHKTRQNTELLYGVTFF
ncbi:putative deoxyribonuclease TATDN2 [Asterias amurensis]|uniref:putative deoxyribonuclease TATDN2 n=1 Tax=Asterias amurensis TaxID=7602 RepID=UPI003AB86034